jgi:hypothetical protein
MYNENEIRKKDSINKQFKVLAHAKFSSGIHLSPGTASAVKIDGQREIFLLLVVVSLWMASVFNG